MSDNLNNTNLSSDMAGAKLLGKKAEIVMGSWIEGEEIQVGEFVSDEDGEFTLSDPATRDDVVQVLGEKHHIVIDPDCSNSGEWTGWAFLNLETAASRNTLKTYEEAIRAAVIEVIK